MTKTMTEGKPLKLILAFALPLLLGNLFQQTYNLVDTAIVGRTLGSNALASVGVSSSVQFLVLGFCQGMSIGFSIPVATKLGAGKLHEMKQYVYTGSVLAGIIAIILTVLTCLLCGSILSILQTPAEVLSGAYSYLFTIFCGIPCTILYNYLSSILRAIGDSKTPFFFLAFSAVLNVFLDLFFIVSCHMGVFGAAFATILSQGVSGLLCLILIVKKVDILHPGAEDRILEKDKVMHALNMGMPMGLQFSITAIGSMVMQTSNNSLGTVYVSAYAAGLKIKQFMMSPFDAIATAASTFASQNYGAEKSERIHSGIRIGISLAVVYSLFATAAMVVFGRDLSMLFLDAGDTAILDASALYLKSIGYFYSVLGVLIVARQSVQGLGFSQRAVLAGVIEMIARCVICLGFTSAYGFMAICSADQAAWITGTLYLIPTLIHCLKRADSEIACSHSYKESV